MTNKPMLSVERELLERVADNRYRDKERISIARHEALWELRALLDEPPHTRQEGYGEAFNRVSSELEEMKVAQHQREPVYQFRNTKLGCVWRDADFEAYASAAKLLNYERRVLYAEQPAPVADVPEGYCIMPRRLTAENGAKALLTGEFQVEITTECPECRDLEEPLEGCEFCDGEGEYEQRHTIPWDQIKFIYSQAVAGLARINKPL